MKARTIIIILALFLTMGTGLGLYSCTENIRTRAFGGKGTLNLPAGKKLINATWKETDLWFLTRTMTDKDIAETYTFTESSSFGVFEGEITIVEHK